jgi:serine/threonine protein kinase
VLHLIAVSHPNVARSFGWTTSPQLCLVQEFLHGFSLYHQLYIENWAPMPNEVLSAALDVARGMEYLHTAWTDDSTTFTQPVIHRDLKSGNLMLTQMPGAGREPGPVLKITDFGLTRESHVDGHALTVSTAGGTVGTPLWMAPEILLAKTCDEKVDVFSYAMCLVELVDCKLPWSGIAMGAEVPHKVTRGERPLEQLSGTDDRPVNRRLVELIKSCWDAKASRRPDFTTIIQLLKDIRSSESTSTVTEEYRVR